MASVTELLARQAAIDVVLRYTDALDFPNRDQFKSCWAIDAEIDLRPFSVLGMQYEVIKGREAITAACMDAVGTAMITTHSLTNFLVILNEQNDSATLSCYSESQHVKAGQAFQAESQDNSLIVKCRYQATIRKQESGWKITAFKITPLWAKGSTSVFSPPNSESEPPK